MQLFRPCGNLQLELAVAQADRVHPQFLACANFPHKARSPTTRISPGFSRSPHLDLAESRFFSEYVATVGKINFFDGRLAVEPPELSLWRAGFWVQQS